jgi:hypothetical protein
MPSWDSSIIEIKCACGHETHLDRGEQEKKFGIHILIVDLNIFYEQFKCEKCGSKHPKVFDKNRNLLFDPTNLKKCSICRKFIPIPRLNNPHPENEYCSSECGHALRYISPEEEKKMAERSALFSKVVKKEKEEEQKLRAIKLNKFQEKKYVMVGALKSLKEGSITKSEYEKIFKQVSWWIKEKVEEMEGRIIDNPTKYINCPKCTNLTLILWTPKYNRYFLGCSEYRNGCTWTKAIWVHDD